MSSNRRLKQNVAAAGSPLWEPAALRSMCELLHHLLQLLQRVVIEGNKSEGGVLCGFHCTFKVVAGTDDDRLTVSLPQPMEKLFAVAGVLDVKAGDTEGRSGIFECFKRTQTIVPHQHRVVRRNGLSDVSEECFAGAQDQTALWSLSHGKVLRELVNPFGRVTLPLRVLN